MPSVAPTVLVAEDEMLIRLTAADLLSAAGFSVLEAEHADEAVQLLNAHGNSVHVLFTDIHMPGSMNGLDLAHYVRSHYPEVALIVVSGNMKPGDSDMPVGSRFLPKPYDPEHVVQIIRNLLKQ